MTINLILKPITGENRDIAEALTVFPHQAGYIETVRECLKEADQLDAWRPICILDGDSTHWICHVWKNNGTGKYKAVV